MFPQCSQKSGPSTLKVKRALQYQPKQMIKIKVTFSSHGRGKKLNPKDWKQNKTKQNKNPQKNPGEYDVQEMGRGKEIIRYLTFPREIWTHTLFCPPLSHESCDTLSCEGQALHEYQQKTLWKFYLFFRIMITLLKSNQLAYLQPMNQWCHLHKTKQSMLKPGHREKEKVTQIKGHT